MAKRNHTVTTREGYAIWSRLYDAERLPTASFQREFATDQLDHGNEPYRRKEPGRTHAGLECGTHGEEHPCLDVAIPVSYMEGGIENSEHVPGMEANINGEPSVTVSRAIHPHSYPVDVRG